MEIQERIYSDLPLDALVRQTLTDFTDFVFTEGWRGREREAVSLYALGYLIPSCRVGAAIEKGTQIGIEVAVPQLPSPGAKAQVCKDIVLWPRPAMTCWDKNGSPTIYPMAIMEWKANQTFSSQRDVEWLVNYSRDRASFLGYSICVDFSARVFRMLCVRVENGLPEEWLRI